MLKNEKAHRVSAGPKRSSLAHHAILEAAEEILTTGGVSALTYEAVARRAKAGKPTIYKWWPNKFSLILEVYHRGKFREIEVPDTGNVRDDLLAYTRLLWSYWRETPGGIAFAALLTEAQTSIENQKVLAERFYEGDNDDAPATIIFNRAVERDEFLQEVDIVTLRRAYVSLNWFHLLCGRLDESAIASVVDVLLGAALRSSKKT